MGKDSHIWAPTPLVKMERGQLASRLQEVAAASSPPGSPSSLLHFCNIFFLPHVCQMTAFLLFSLQAPLIKMALLSNQILPIRQSQGNLPGPSQPARNGSGYSLMDRTDT